MPALASIIIATAKPVRPSDRGAGREAHGAGREAHGAGCEASGVGREARKAHGAGARQTERGARGAGRKGSVAQRRLVSQLINLRPCTYVTGYFFTLKEQYWVTVSLVDFLIWGV